MNSFFANLPKIYQRYWSQELLAMNPAEKTATCDNCLCSQKKLAWLPYHKPNLKCCTFHPFLPNYLVGEILSSNSSRDEYPVVDSFKNLIREKIQKREYALPLGIFAPPKYQAIFAAREPQDFGTREDLLCPYFSKENNNCGIWKFRGSVCSTYFCTSDRQEKGMTFWEAMSDYLHGLEMILSQDAIAQRGFGPDAIESQLEYMNCISGTPSEMSSYSMDSSMFKMLWQDYKISEIEEFYIHCAESVRSLDRQGWHNLTFDDLSEMEKTLVNLYQKAGF